MANLQIRNVPDELHRALKLRAASEGKSLSELMLDELKRSLALPTRRELRERLAGVKPFSMTESSAGLIRTDRDAL